MLVPTSIQVTRASTKHCTSQEMLQPRLQGVSPSIMGGNEVGRRETLGTTLALAPDLMCSLP